MKHKSLLTMLLLTAVMFFSLAGSLMAAASLRSTPFISASNEKPTYRVPGIVRAKNGDLLAFCEKRSVREDECRSDIVLRRSSDFGRTWKSQQTVAGNNKDRFSYPVPVVLNNGDIIILYNRSDYVANHADRTTRTVHRKFSYDNGKTWTTAKNITNEVKNPSWDWHGLGPGHGIVKQQTPNQGRIIIPARKEDPGRSYVIYSDNNGLSWNYGGRLDAQSSECAVVELTNGNIMLNARCANSGYRRVAISTNGGGSFGASYLDTNLKCPGKAGSLLRYSDKILFSNPNDSTQFTKGTVRRSSNNGSTWPSQERYIPNGEWSTYSDIVRIDNGDVGVLVEWGKNLSSPHQQIRFYRVRKGDLGL